MSQKSMFFPSSLMLRLSPHLDQRATLTKSEDLRGQGSKLSVVIKIDPCVAWHAQLKYAAAYHNYKLKCRSKVPPDNYKKFSMLSSS